MRDRHMEPGEFHPAVEASGKRLNDPALQDGFGAVDHDANLACDNRQES